MAIKNFRIDEDTAEKVKKVIGNRSESDFFREAVIEKLDREGDYLDQLYLKKDKIEIEIAKIEQLINEEEAKRYGNKEKKQVKAKNPIIKRSLADNELNYNKHKNRLPQLIKLKSFDGLINDKVYLSAVANNFNIDYDFLRQKIVEEFSKKSVM